MRLDKIFTIPSVANYPKILLRDNWYNDNYMSLIQEKIATYSPAQLAIDAVGDSKLVLLVGITGAGKDTIKNALLREDDFYNFVSYTTRQPRENKGVLEQNGREYHFITVDEAMEMLERGEFIEAKEYAGNIYGTAFEGLQQAVSEGKIAINDVEVQGVEEYKKYIRNAIAVFILPPNFEEWQRRLQLRYDPEEFRQEWPKRREAAIRELEHALKVPYYHFVINDELDKAVEATKVIAHNDDMFTRKDDEARLLARDILDAIRKHV